MIELDGSQKSGSGTIVRDVVPFSAFVGRELHLTNIRAKREKPGLRAQHLKALEAAARICRGKIRGAAIGSKEIFFSPGKVINGGRYRWDIGTAGSTAMLSLSLLPMALFADEPSTYDLTGGLFQDFAPSAYHVKFVLIPMLRKMGANLDLEILQPGYVPRGNGQVQVRVSPMKGPLKPLHLAEQGKVEEIRGIALSSLLEERSVSDRMVKKCRAELKARGYDPKLEILYDTRKNPSYRNPSIQAGACLAVWAKTATGCLIGSDMAGAPRRTAESIGTRVARNLLEDLDSGATVDRHLADQLVPFAALADGVSSYVIPGMTDHIEARLWLIEEILGAKAEVKGRVLTIQGIGYLRTSVPPGK